MAWEHTPFLFPPFTSVEGSTENSAVGKFRGGKAEFFSAYFFLILTSGIVLQNFFSAEFSEIEP